MSQDIEIPICRVSSQVHQITCEDTHLTSPVEIMEIVLFCALFRCVTGKPILLIGKSHL
jgi:hypothetical protein